MINPLSLAKVSNFRIILPSSQKNIEFYCQEVNLPGITIGSIESGFMGMKDNRPGDSITFNPLTLTIICDQSLETYKEVYAMLKLTHDPITNILHTEQEVFDGYLTLNTNKNNIIHTIHFYDCFIKDVSDIQFQTTSGEENPFSFTLGIVYNLFSFE